MKKDMKFKWSDAWLLLSIIYASNKKSVSLAEIIAQGDYINHAIFSWQELQGGLFRLLKAGYIVENKNQYCPAPITWDAYNKFQKKTKNVFKQLEFVRILLDSPEWSSKHNPTEANEGIHYPKVTEAFVKSAYESYIERNGTVGK